MHLFMGNELVETEINKRGGGRHRSRSSCIALGRCPPRSPKKGEIGGWVPGVRENGWVGSPRKGDIIGGNVNARE